MSANHIKKSALALIDGNHLWDMHRPLTNSCSLEVSVLSIRKPVRVQSNIHTSFTVLTFHDERPDEAKHRLLADLFVRPRNGRVQVFQRQIRSELAQFPFSRRCV